jgi:hypothetical protein
VSATDERLTREQQRDLNNAFHAAHGAVEELSASLHESALWQREDQPEPIGREEAIGLAPDLAEQVRDTMADLGRRPADVLN